MKKVFLTVLFLSLATTLFGQEYLINGFDEAEADTNYWLFFDNDGAEEDSSFIDVTFPTDNVYEGTGAMRLDYKVHNTETWGGFAKLEHWTPDSTGFYDFSNYDSMSVWYNNLSAQTIPGRVHLRINLHDASENGADVYDVGDAEYYYSFHYVLDNEPGWKQIKFPMVNNADWGSTGESGGGLNLTGWSGITGNSTFDADMLKGWSFEFSISGGGDGDAVSGTVLLDKFHLSGAAENPWLIFNGKTVDPTMGAFTWGQSALEVVEGGGQDPATNALLWTQGNEWNNGWSGAGWNVDPAKDIAFRWDLDSLKFAAKIDAGTGALRAQFESGADGIVGHVFDPIADGEWHEYSFALRDFVNIDGTTNFNPAAITVMQFMGEGSAIAGQKIYFDYIWTGDPEIDVVPPAAPGLVTASPGSYVNLITWADVPGEDGELYDVYYAESEITDLDAKGVDVVGKGIAEGTQIAEHVLRAPVVDQDLTYYYAVVAVDAAGNESEIAPASAAVTNTAQGVTTIHTEAPPSFVADGDLSEWAGITPFRMYPSDGSGSIVTNTSIDGDADLSLNNYVAMDDTYIYLAFDVEDDIVSIDTTISTYLTDGCDIFLGLYDWRGESHNSYKRGDEPDYHWRFVSTGILADNPGGDDYAKNGDGNYAFVEKFPSGYAIEARISWEDIAATADDKLFSPIPGQRIKIDYSINDADATGEREGILTLSPENEDLSWRDVWRWTYTWVGDVMVGTDEDSFAPVQFNLAQNYPNPFNPSTQIQYSIKELSNVSIKVFNVLGQEVAQLVNEVKNPGVYKVNFDASSLSTGIYMYQIQAGNFVAVKKMMLIK